MEKEEWLDERSISKTASLSGNRYKKIKEKYGSLTPFVRKAYNVLLASRINLFLYILFASLASLGILLFLFAFIGSFQFAYLVVSLLIFANASIVVFLIFTLRRGEK